MESEKHSSSRTVLNELTITIRKKEDHKNTPLCIIHNELDAKLPGVVVVVLEHQFCKARELPLLEYCSCSPL